MNRIVNTVLDLLFPPKCVFCRRVLANGSSMCCPSCMGKLPLTPAGARVQSFRHTEKCIAPLYYENQVRESLLRYKFGGLNCYCRFYGPFIAKSIDESGIFCDIITWVPLSRTRLRKRGYDQARLLAEEISAALGIKCVSSLRKIRHTKAQSSLKSKEARKANAANAYTVIDPEAVRGKRVLLVDDIVTTGSTLSECARILRASGAETVIAAAAARKRD